MNIAAVQKRDYPLIASQNRYVYFFSISLTFSQGTIKRGYEGRMVRSRFKDVHVINNVKTILQHRFVCILSKV